MSILVTVSSLGADSGVSDLAGGDFSENKNKQFHEQICQLFICVAII